MAGREHANAEAPPQAASAGVGAMPLTASTAGTLDGGEGPKMSRSLPSIGPFAHDDTPDARSGQGGRPYTNDIDLRRQAVIRPTNSPEDPNRKLSRGGSCEASGRLPCGTSA